MARFNKHPILALLLTNALLFLFLAFTLEVLLRVGLSKVLFHGEESASVSPRSTFPDSLTHHDYRPDTSFIRIPSKFDTFQPVTNRINSLGFRGPKPGAKSTFRVLILGDSFIEADEVSYEDSIANLLNLDFQDRIEFFSHGIGGWAPTNEFAWLYHRGYRLEPDEVNLFLCANDFFRRTTYHLTDEAMREKAIYEGNVPVGFLVDKTPLWRRFELLRTTERGLRTLGGKYGRKNRNALEYELLEKESSEWPDDLRNAVDGTLRVVGNMKDWLRKKGITLNVLIVPLGFAWENETVAGKQNPHYQWDAGFTVGQDGIESYLSEWCAKQDLRFIELRPAFEKAKAVAPETLLFNEADCHWNKKGHEIVASVLREFYESRSDI